MRRLALLLPLGCLVSMGSPVKPQEPTARLFEDERVSVALDTLVRREAFRIDIGGTEVNFSSSYPDHDVVSVLITVVGVRGGHVGITDANSAFLVDTDGHEHTAAFIRSTSRRAGPEDPEGVIKVVSEGDELAAFFAAPKRATPAVMRWVYAHWASPDGQETEQGVLEMNLDEPLE